MPGIIPPAVEEDPFDLLLDNVDSPSFAHKVRAKERDIAFLSDFLNDPSLQSLIAAYETLEDVVVAPEDGGAQGVAYDIVNELDQKSHMSRGAKELRQLLCDPNMKRMIEAHDLIANKHYGDDLDLVPLPPDVLPLSDPAPPDAIRMVTIRKKPGESLGITVQQNANKDLYIARVMAGSHVEKQGLLNVGDIIKELNGKEVQDPDQLLEMINAAEGNITLKVLPSYYDNTHNAQMFLKAHFSYDPSKDNLIPSRQAGLAFKEGEILMVVNMDDPNWWQAKRMSDPRKSGLIPSRTLEEKRKAFVPPELDYTNKSLLCGLMTKKKKKIFYQAQQSQDFDKCNLLIYEEVAKLPPFMRKTLVLIGPQGIGRRSIKMRLCKASPDLFEMVVPYTTRPPRPGEESGHQYHFTTRGEMEMDIYNNLYLEYGELDGNMYGIKYESVRSVIRRGKMCVLDIGAAAIKAVKTGELTPYVIFLASPSVDILRNMYEYAVMNNKPVKPKSDEDFKKTVEESKYIERNYREYFDKVILNENMESTYQELRHSIDKLSAEPQWVPVTWVY